jgi:hypothetical protein
MDVLIITVPLITREFISVLLVYGYHLLSIIGHITLLIEPILLMDMAIGSGFRATGRRDGPHMDGKVSGFQAIGAMNIKGRIL